MFSDESRSVIMHNEQTTPKTILIGGLTGGIGSALARQLTAKGDTVVGFSRSATDGAAACDATDAQALAEYCKQAANKHGRIDAYVHAIGSIYLKPAHLTPVEDWLNVMNQNLNSAFYALRAMIPILQKQGAGRMLFFSSVAAEVGLANHEAIAAAKGGLSAMVRTAAATYAPRGIRINAIAPSLTDTPMSSGITGNEQALKISQQMHPLGAINTAADVASLATWLLSDAAQQVTGQVFVMDGGLSSIVPKPKL
jgi:NAD(P)-dependent dehydrogenase (short-subunit alcohol dehydrogenase family)